MDVISIESIVKNILAASNLQESKLVWFYNI